MILKNVDTDLCRHLHLGPSVNPLNMHFVGSKSLGQSANHVVH